MNEEQNNQKKEPIKITLGLALGWGVGVLAAISGVTLLFFEPLTGFLMLLLAVVLLPPANKFITDKLNFSISRGMKIIVVIILFGVIGATVSTDSTSNITSSNKQRNEQVAAEQQGEVQKAENKIVEEEEQEEVVSQTKTATENKPAPISSETVSQKNAIRSAKTYLNYSAFSHDGLIAQLEYEQFSYTDAVYGADNSGANWNEQAAKAAKSYIEYSAFSRGSLIEQLKYEKFTQAQAEYGASAVGL